MVKKIFIILFFLPALVHAQTRQVNALRSASDNTNIVHPIPITGVANDTLVSKKMLADSTAVIRALIPTGSGGSLSNIVMPSGFTVTGNGTATATVSVTGTTTWQALIPAANNTYDLGASGSNWSTVWGNAVRANSSNPLTLRSGAVGQAINFTLSTTNAVAQFTATNGNLILQNGGTFTDNGINRRLQVHGTAYIYDSLKVGTTPAAANFDSVIVKGTDSSMKTKLLVGGTNISIANATGTLTFNLASALTGVTINGNTFTTGTYTLTGTAGKTLTFNNSITLAGTDATTMTFPSTSATIARTDAGQTFTGHNTFEGVTATGATGTGNMVFSASPTFSGAASFNTFGSTTSGASIFAVGTSGWGFRTTNGGTTVNMQSIFDVDNSGTTAGAQAFGFETANGFIFTHANGVRRIMGAAIKLTNLTNTAGSEASDLAFYTQSGGTAASEKMRIFAAGGIGINTTSTNGSTLQVGGSISGNYVEKTTTYSATASDQTINCTTGTFTVTLPTAVGIQGRYYWIKNTGTGTITVATTSSQTFDGGATTLTLTQNQRALVQSTNAGWIILVQQ